jgi:uncharacterized membrane protein
MRRSKSVTWAAAATIVESLPPLAIGLFAALEMFGIAPHRGRDPSVFFSGFELFCIFVLSTMTGLWGLISAIGVLAMKRWGRYLIIAFAALMTVIMAMYLAEAIAIILAHKRKPSSIMAYWMGIPTFYIGVSVWSLRLFMWRPVAQEFEGTAALS